MELASRGNQAGCEVNNGDRVLFGCLSARHRGVVESWSRSAGAIRPSAPDAPLLTKCGCRRGTTRPDQWAGPARSCVCVPWKSAKPRAFIPLCFAASEPSQGTIRSTQASQVLLLKRAAVPSRPVQLGSPTLQTLSNNKRAVVCCPPPTTHPMYKTSRPLF